MTAPKSQGSGGPRNWTQMGFPRPVSYTFSLFNLIIIRMWNSMRNKNTAEFPLAQAVLLPHLPHIGRCWSTNSGLSQTRTAVSTTTRTAFTADCMNPFFIFFIYLFYKKWCWILATDYQDCNPCIHLGCYHQSFLGFSRILATGPSKYLSCVHALHPLRNPGPSSCRSTIQR